MAWTVKSDWRHKAVEVVRRTEKMVAYMDHSWSKRETRANKNQFLEWEGSQDQAVLLAAELNALKDREAEERRALTEKFTRERKALIAQVMEGCTPTETPNGGTSQ